MPRRPNPLSRFALCLLGSALCVSAAASEIESRYQKERAACEAMPIAEQRASCLREAAAARNAALQGQLDSAPSVYEQNALARCLPLPLLDRDACVRRVRGEGESSGSVTGGGILREYRVITLPPATPSIDATSSGTSSSALVADTPQAPALSPMPPMPTVVPSLDQPIVNTVK